MAFTKEDYMRLPKERLAEMLVERDNDSAGKRIEPNPYELYPTIRPYSPWLDAKFEVTCEN